MTFRTVLPVRVGLFGLVFAVGLALAFPQTASAVSLPVIDSSLKLWLDAGSITGLNNGDPVGTWTDLSSSGNNATQSGTARPTYVTGVLNRMPVVRFDAVDDSMVTPLNLPAPYTVFAVFDYNTTAGAFRRAIQGSNNWLIGPYQNAVRNHAVTGWVDNAAATVVQGRFYTAEASNTGAASRFRVDAANYTASPGNVGSPGTVYLGGAGLYPGEVLNGDIAEVLVYNRVLSNAEMNQVGTYLRVKYGLNSGYSLALGQPIIDSSGSYSTSYSADRVTDGIMSDTITPTSSYWLGRQGVVNEYVTLDLGASLPINSIALRNTHNQAANDRGTRAFEIWASNSVDGSNHLANPVKILSGTLTTSRGPNGDTLIPLDTFSSLNGLAAGSYRYLRFNTLGASFNNGNVGLNEIQVFSDWLPANVAAGKPVTASTSYSAQFGPAAVSDQRIDDFRTGTGEAWDGTPGGMSSYWLAPDGLQPNQSTPLYVTVDLQGLFTVNRIDLQNTHNGNSNDRGTANFRIATSLDNTTFTTVYSGTLASVWNTGADIPIQSFSVANGDFLSFQARYVRLYADTWYGAGAGLNEIFVFAQVPEPSTLALACLGLVGLAASGRGLRRPRKRT